MPFKSDKQRRFLYSQFPELAKEFAAKERPGSYKQRQTRQRRKKSRKRKSY